MPKFIAIPGMSGYYIFAINFETNFTTNFAINFATNFPANFATNFATYFAELQIFEILLVIFEPKKLLYNLKFDFRKDTWPCVVKDFEKSSLSTDKVFWKNILIGDENPLIQFSNILMFESEINKTDRS